MHVHVLLHALLLRVNRAPCYVVRERGQTEMAFTHRDSQCIHQAHVQEGMQQAAHLVDPRLLVAPHQWCCHGNTRLSAESLSVSPPGSSRVPLHTGDLALQAMTRNSFKVYAFTFQMVAQHLRKDGGWGGGRKEGGRNEREKEMNSGCTQVT